MNHACLEPLAESHAHFNEMLAPQFKTIFAKKINDLNYFIYTETTKIKYHQE